MTNAFFERPILNSPYDYPNRHWELDEDGQPTQRIIETRRAAKFVTPIPKPKKRRGQATQQVLFDVEELRGKDQYDPSSIIERVRHEIDAWRAAPESDWRVTPETARLLRHWRHHDFQGIRPFFCQVEAVETAIWLTEVAPRLGKRSEAFLQHLKAANENANPGLPRLALKLATGAGKTTVMAMLIAWQTINAVRRPTSTRFTRHFLIVTPGLTIRDRLRVLQPGDPDSYFKTRDLVPEDLRETLNQAIVVITNYHAFRRRELLDISKGGRSLLQGRHGEPITTQESEGQMLQRVMPEFLGETKRAVMVLNDEAHHCYRARPGEDSDELKGDDKNEADKNNEAARLWISGLEALSRARPLLRIVDLSATPFFLRGSGYVEGTLFPWTMSDFSLMDAIECGIVKLPRVPVADNIPGADVPMYRNLWEHIGKLMPKKGRGKAAALNPLDLPTQLQTALDALYGHYKQTFDLWAQTPGLTAPPCFIIVCNNTASSKLVYDYIAGFTRTAPDGSPQHIPGRLPLFRNHDESGQPLGRPRTLLIDSEQLESGEALDASFRELSAAAIERFRRELVERSGDPRAGDNITDQDILREAMNTVGKQGRLGESIRCVVSVSMLTEGWDANTVTHVLGIRAFGTQLLCEQVIGRALRRRSYELGENGLFGVEYADVLGIPFDFTAKPVIAPPQPPRETVRVHAVPERSALEIRFPRILGYRVEMPGENITADFNDESRFTLTPQLVGATETRNAGIIGAPADLTLTHTADVRPAQILFELTTHLLQSRWIRTAGEAPPLYLFGRLKRIVQQWLDECFTCAAGATPAQLKYKTLADIACEKIAAAITRAHSSTRPVKAVIDPYNPSGSTRHTNFTTSKETRWQTSADKCHINWAICDSDWEAEFCRIVESHPRVRAYVKNQGLGLEVPYRLGGQPRRYLPDFIVLVDDGHGANDLLHLVVEIKGYRGEDAKIKAETMHTYWIPCVNSLGLGRWAFTELRDAWTMQADMQAALSSAVDDMLQRAGSAPH